MKTNWFFGILISVLLTLNLCTQSSKTEPSGPVTGTKPGVTSTTNPDTIPKDTAIAWMRKWETTRDSIDKYLDKSAKGGKKNTLDSLVVKGFLIPKGELAKIAEHPNDSIWAMLAVKWHPGKNGKPGKNRAGLIFMCYKKKEPKEALPSTGELTFYDFTRPCPPNCLND